MANSTPPTLPAPGVTSPMLIIPSQQQNKHNNFNVNNNNSGDGSSLLQQPQQQQQQPQLCNNSNNGCCLTSDIGPDLEPILTVDSPKRREAFEKAYRVGPIIGKGGFGKVFAGERLKDRLPVAIKHINKTKISSWCTVSQIVSLSQRYRHKHRVSAKNKVKLGYF